MLLNVYMYKYVSEFNITLCMNVLFLIIVIVYLLYNSKDNYVIHCVIILSFLLVFNLSFLINNMTTSNRDKCVYISNKYGVKKSDEIEVLKNVPYWVKKEWDDKLCKVII